MTNSSEADEPRRDARIALAVEQRRNRELLSDWLTTYYDVSVVDLDQLSAFEADCIITDVPAIERAHSVLRDRIASESPVVLPVLLLSGEGTDLDPRTWELVDDVIGTPVQPQSLQSRLENLLQLRSLSLELKRRKERSEDRFFSLFDGSPDPIVVVDEAGTITATNRGFATIVGRSEDDLEGTLVTDLGFEPADRVRQFLVDSPDGLEEDAIVEFEDEEGTRSFELNVSPVSDSTLGRERIAVFRDVTVRQAQHDRLQRKTERLEEFSSIVSHDLRNPLTVARGHLELAKETDDPKHFEAAEGALDRMSAMIEDLLSMAREGALVEETKRVDLSDTAMDAWETTGFSEEASLELDDLDDFSIRGDEDALRQVLENLFRNAIEHGRPDVSIRIGTTADGFFVADDGQGIKPSRSEEIFESGVSSNETGTGFGLAIVRRIADAHGWSVSAVESRDGGARFVFEQVETQEGSRVGSER